MVDSAMVKLSDLYLNNGQIPGVPKNPRFIRDERFESLRQSIIDDPEMLELRELLVYPFDGKYVVIGGNMRLRALADLKYKEAPVKILPEDTSSQKLRAITIKDNVAYGSDDMDALMNEWDTDELKAWGMELGEADEEDENKEVEETDDLVLKWLGDDGLAMRASLGVLKGTFDRVHAAEHVQNLIDDFGDYDEATQVSLILNALRNAKQ